MRSEIAARVFYCEAERTAIAILVSDPHAITGERHARPRTHVRSGRFDAAAVAIGIVRRWGVRYTVDHFARLRGSHELDEHRVAELGVVSCDDDSRPGCNRVPFTQRGLELARLARIRDTRTAFDGSVRSGIDLAIFRVGVAAILRVAAVLRVRVAVRVGSRIALFLLGRRVVAAVTARDRADQARRSEREAEKPARSERTPPSREE